MRSLLPFVLISLLCAPLRADDPPPQPTPAAKGQEVTPRRIVDHDHGFELFVLGEDWQLLDEEAAREVDLDAVAGVFDPTAASVLVIPLGPIPADGRGEGGRAGLSAAAEGALLRLPLLEKKVALRQSLLHDDALPARELKGEGRLPDGTRLSFALRIVASRGCYYAIQVLSGGPGISSAPWLAVRFLPGQGPPPGRARPASQAAGVGWRRVEQRLESVSGLRARGGEGWRVLDPHALHGAPLALEARLVHVATFLELDLSPLPADPADQARVLAGLERLAATGARVGEQARRLELELSGGSAWLRVVAREREPVVACGALVRGGHVVALFARWDASLGADADRLLREGLGRVAVLGAAAREALSRELASGPRAVALSPDQRLDQGVLRDFGQDLRWTLPPRPFWRVQLATPEAAARRLQALDPERGLELSLDVTQSPGAADAASRAASLVALAKQLEAKPLGEVQRHGVLDLLWLEREEQGVPERLLAACGDQGARRLTLCARGPRASVAALGSSVDAVLGRLELGSPEVRRMTEALPGGVLVDRRLGLRLRPPAGFHARPGQGPLDLLRVGGSAELRGEQEVSWLGVIARCEPWLGPRARALGDERWIARLRQATGGLQPGDLREAAGRPCTHWFGKGPRGDRCDVLVIDGPLRYLILITDRGGRHPRDSGLLGALGLQ
ncbi:MAG: hypothetical protein AB7N76_20300 [Planctomycetota bacterium]